MIQRFNILSLVGLIMLLTCVSACKKTEDTATPTTNNAPQVSTALGDLNLTTGFGSQAIDLSKTFNDADNDALTFTASSSNTAVVTVSIDNSTLTVTEVGEGNSVVTVTATDVNKATVSDDFNCVVSATTTDCTLDNTTTTDLSDCKHTSSQASLTASVTESIANGVRTIVTNNVPNHNFGSPPDKIKAVDFTWTMPSSPTKASQTTPVVGANSLEYQFGVALNGVKIDPGANFPFENPNTGEQNYGWVLEATTNTSITTLDCNQAHLQPDGAYHYHGDFSGYAATLNADATKMTQVGWAADGYPVYYKYAYSSASDINSTIVELKSSYRLKSGERPGDGISAPCGTYTGKYEADYEYVASLSDLDECNGRFGVTPEFPGGTYYYVITADYPIIPRCFWGTPDQSFKIGR